ncbi:MAG: hypothetical protein ACXVHS_10960 [Methanobacterium sp.]
MISSKELRKNPKVKKIPNSVDDIYEGMTIFSEDLMERLKKTGNKKRYLICESCMGYYKLRKDESLEDFDHCQCGGQLKFIDNLKSSQLFR